MLYTFDVLYGMSKADILDVCKDMPEVVFFKDYIEIYEYAGTLADLIINNESVNVVIMSSKNNNRQGDDDVATCTKKTITLDKDMSIQV